MSHYPVNSALRRALQRITSSNSSHHSSSFLKSRYYSTKQSKPLRILFCGSDEFSTTSLLAIHSEQRQNPTLIKSIDVLCRPGKRAGRSLKKIREVPIKAVAEKLGLPIHERDTFKGWELPRPEGEAINLIIAVSFGLFVPSRVLKTAEYGGLNVHPSMLPQFRGPAPIQHTIMKGHRKTGVTVQTLDEKSFDHGIILAQTPGDGVLIPHGSKCTFPSLLDFVSNLGAEMLIQALRDGVHVPPLQHKGRTLSKQEQESLIHATRITSNDRQMPFGLNATTTAIRLERALGRVWCNVWVNDKTQKRLTFEGLSEETLPNLVRRATEATEIRNSNGSESILENNQGSELPEVHQPIYSVIMTRDDGEKRASPYFEDGDNIILVFPKKCLRVEYITVEGRSKMPAAKAMRSIRKTAACDLGSNSEFGSGHNPLEIRLGGINVEPLG